MTRSLICSGPFHQFSLYQNEIFGYDTGNRKLVICFRGSPGMQRIFTPWRLKWYPRLLLFAFGAAFIIAALSGRGASTLTGRLGGDYPAFYSAGRIIAEGNWKDLYNLSKQARLKYRRSLDETPHREFRFFSWKSKVVKHDFALT